MKKHISFLSLLTFSFAIQAKPELLITCKFDENDVYVKAHYVLHPKTGVVELLRSDSVEVGLLEVEQHFYKFHFTQNSPNLGVKKTNMVVNRVTGEFTKTITGNNFNNGTKEQNIATGECFQKDYEQLL